MSPLNRDEVMESYSAEQIEDLLSQRMQQIALLEGDVRWLCGIWSMLRHDQRMEREERVCLPS
jgi:hypothetical protein